MEEYTGYVKVKQGDTYITSPNFHSESKRKLTMRLKVWLFDNSFDNQTPFVIMIKPELGGTYECHLDNLGASHELYSII